MRIAARSVLALALLVAAGAFTATSAQQGGVEDEDVPTLDMTDVPRPAPTPTPARTSSGVVGRAETSADGASGSAFDAFRSIAPGEPSPEAAAILRRLDAGDTVSFALRFQISPDGRPSNLVVEQGTGIPSVDEALLNGFAQGVPGSGWKEISDFGDMRVAVTISRQRLSASFSASARTPERAAEVAEQGRALIVLGKGAFRGDPDAEQLGRAISITNSGPRLTVGIDLDLGLLERLARKSKSAIRVSAQ